MIPAFTPICPACHQPMTKWTEKFDDKGKTVHVGYMCACKGSVYYENFWAGDQHQERKNAQIQQGRPS